MRKSLFCKLILPLSAVVSIALFQGCGGAKSDNKTKLAFITNGPADFWIYAQAGVDQAEKEFDDISVDFRVGDGTPGKQRQIAEDLMVRGIKGFAISPTKPAEQTQMINDWASKVTVISVDSDAPESDRTTYIGTDNVAAGRMAGELVKEALPKGGKLMAFVGLGDAQNAQERFRGLNEALEGAGFEVLGLRTDDMDFGKARRNAEDTLTKHPDIAAMVGLWSYNAPQILEAVKGANKLDQVKIIAFDEDPVTLEAVARGEIFGTIVQNPYEFGYQSMKLLRSIVVEGKSGADAGVPENEQIIIDTKIIRKDEAKAYLDYCNGLKEKMK